MMNSFFCLQNRFTKPHVFCAMLCAIVSSSAHALELSAESVSACTSVPDRFDRLACFDKLLQTPQSVIAGQPVELWQEKQTVSSASNREYLGPLERITHGMEKERISGDPSWQFRYSRVGGGELRTLTELIKDIRDNDNKPLIDAFEDESNVLPEKAAAALVARSPENTLEPGTVNIYLTMSETPSADAIEDDQKAILLLSCEADITTARLVLPEKVATRRNSVEVRVDGNVPERSVWQTSDNERVIMAARGLGSISHITKWIQSSRLQFDVVIDGQEKAMLFETDNLKELLQPLRRACRW